MSGVDVLADVAAGNDRAAKFYRDEVRPSARKSFGSFKPVLVYPGGRTEICGQRAVTSYKIWQASQPDPKSAYVKYSRGKTFPTRDEAIAYAADYALRRSLDAERRAEHALAALARVGSP